MQLEEEEEYLSEFEEEPEEEPEEGLDLEVEPPEASLDEILAKKSEEGLEAEEEEEEESILDLDREDRLETLSVRVEPKKDTEFVCRKCFLVKPIRSQLADRKRMLCRDCA